MLYGCATWTMRSQDFSSLRTAHHKLLLRIIGFRRKDRIGYKPLSYREVLREDRFRTHRNDNSEAPTWVRRGPCTTRRLKAVKASHVWAAGGARTQARRSTGDVVGGLPTEKSRGLRRDPAQGQRTEWVAFGVVVKDGRDWMTAAKNMDKWHRGVERGAKHSTAPGDARTFVNPTCNSSARLVKSYSKYVCDFCFLFLFCFASLLLFLGVFLPVIYRRGVRYSRCPSLWLCTSFLI